MENDILHRIPPRINVHYLLTVRGAISVTELLFGLIVASCANVEVCMPYPDGDIDCGSASEMGFGGEAFVVFVAILGLIFTTLLLFSYLLELQDRVLAVPWLSVEMVGVGLMAVLYFIAMGVGSFFADGAMAGPEKASRAGVRGAWVAAAVFSAFNWLLYSASLAALWWRSRS